MTFASLQGAAPVVDFDDANPRLRSDGGVPPGFASRVDGSPIPYVNSISSTGCLSLIQAPCSIVLVHFPTMTWILDHYQERFYCRSFRDFARSHLAV
ncbi:hypothetical protein JMJ77_0014538 [Colletotrichum scovillei]|uniref:Uncharacterized protein n=1 Tax=Colletotrichum scovillei TaxID=1209932 RepID=A0A9P7UC46_9PEZI|nr:hypothetical protein JMJ77_0014538 [Colletotrichum scovillei]KAG7066074.1 hypothetical protein JMJ78_0012811 [Colletotrichum scovillei]KAG7068675.1 hypothetical protein JMJ76_0008355 [Colletotrichum scovillei]